jgi:hypothetical protein
MDLRIGAFKNLLRPSGFGKKQYKNYQEKSFHITTDKINSYAVKDKTSCSFGDGVLKYNSKMKLKLLCRSVSAPDGMLVKKLQP